MMSQIEHNSKDILEFVNTKKFNKFKFEHNRKLDYFFKSIQQILVISCKMFSLLNDDDITKRNLENKINKLIILIQDYRKVKQECFDLNKFFDDTILNKFSKLTDLIYKVDKEKLVDKKLCYLCLYDNEFTTESITNIFSYDFHTSCINLWLNKINNKSPYDYL